MPNTYTPNVQLAMPAIGDRGWNVALNSNCGLLDSLAPVGALAVTTTEVPSATLGVRVAPGSYLRQDGTVGSFVGSTLTTLTASSTVYLYLDLTQSGALVAGTSGWPTTAHVRLAVATTSATTVLTLTDARLAFSPAGSIADGVDLVLGSVSGTQIATAPLQKLGFFGATPVIQPTMGAATAGSTYTVNEQTMLQAVYNAARALGLGS